MKHLVLTEKTTLEEALQLLDQNGNGFLAITDPQRKLIGIITDGDIRRAMLNRQFELEKIINKKPTTITSDVPHVKIKQELKRIHRRHMPVVDANGILVEVVVLDDFEVTLKENWVVVMAGGMGTRLGGLTKETPKPMLTVGDKPILQGIMESFKSQGFYRFLLCVNYKSHVIEEYFGNGQAFGVEIRYTKEDKRMGTAGALSLIDFDLEHPLFVVNGDVLTSINFEDFLNFHIVNKSDATMCVKNFSFEVPYACVDFNDQNVLIGLREKPSYEYFVNTGMYVLQPEVIAAIPKNIFYDMPSLFEELMTKGKHTKVFKIDEYWLDIGRPSDYNKANDDVRFRG